MNQNYYVQQPYGKLNETEENIPQGQPVDIQQVQMTRISNPPPAPLPMQATQQLHIQQQQFSQPHQYNYPPLPQQQQQQPQQMVQMPPAQMYASNPVPYNPYAQVQSQVVVPPLQQNFAMVPIVNHPTSRHPQQLYCENCKSHVNTKITLKNGSGAYIAGGVIAACGFWLGCCLIPCMVDDCKDSVHFCSRCGTNLGAKRFLFD